MTVALRQRAGALARVQWRWPLPRPSRGPEVACQREQSKGQSGKPRRESVETEAKRAPEERAPEAYCRLRSAATRPHAAARGSAGAVALVSGRVPRQCPEVVESLWGEHKPPDPGGCTWSRRRSSTRLQARHQDPRGAEGRCGFDELVHALGVERDGQRERTGEYDEQMH